MIDVSVIVLCYKQEGTIRRTLDSILRQKTNYSFEVIIGDDASPDGTRKICEEYVLKYPNLVSITEPHFNYGVVKNYVVCLSRVRGRYIMECAGDDWWHNENKINLQVDYMDSHPECVLSYGGAKLFYPTTNTYKYSRPYNFNTDIFQTLLRLNPIIAPTVCLRTNSVKKIDFDELLRMGVLVEDYPTWLALSNMGNFYAIDEDLVTYSIQYGSLNNTTDFEFKRNTLENVRAFKLYFCNKYNHGDKYNSLIQDVYNADLARASIKYNKRKEAVRSFRAIKNKDIKIITKTIICHVPFLFNLLVKKFNRHILCD